MEGDSTLRDIKRAVRGSVDAYGRLIEREKDYLYRTAFLYSGDEDAAVEIVQETVLKGFRSIRQLREPALFRTWMTRILINVSKDYFRHGYHYEEKLEEETAYEEQGITAEERMDLYEAIRRLPEKYRTVVILSYFDGLKQEEIAFVMGIPRGSVSAYLTRAKQELRKYLKEGYLNG
ncbi:MAG TPA: sigma-70 family RNA polymerase sigma factor [Candidatus Mediterraneibacter intestinavium]|nr:sigma-70 family RNA polymerase sigma factor [Candidatus Mediterraneibacter intestinavium]